MIDYKYLDEKFQISLSKLGTKPVILWGAGSYGVRAKKYIEKLGIKIKFYVDSDSNKWSKKIDEYDIKSPDTITHDDFVIITSSYWFEISTLLKDIGLEFVPLEYVLSLNIDMSLAENLNLLLPKRKIPEIKLEKPIDIIIPVYNGVQFLEPLFESIKKNTLIPYRMIVCNDKSSDVLVKEYLYKFKNANPNIQLIIIENEENLGFVKTVNKLAKLTKNHFVILNTDTEVPPHWLERIIYPILTKDHVASVTPLTNSGTICSFPNCCVDNPMFENLDVTTLDSYFQYVDFEKSYVETPTGVGFCMAINRDAYKKVGDFDEIYGKGYGEENDWCMRAKKKGYLNIIATNLFVYHKHGGSFDNKTKNELMKNNSSILNKKHPSYYAEVNEFIKADPLANLRRILKIKILSEIYKPSIIINHDLGGGANEYMKHAISEKAMSIILKYDDFIKKYILMFTGKKIDELAFQINDLNEIQQLIENIKIKEIVINELVSYPMVLDFLELIINLKKIFSIKLKFMVHDFFCICPIYTLINNNLEYCDIPEDMNYCNKCIKLNPLMKMPDKAYIKGDYPGINLNTWRLKFRELLSNCDEIVCFSESSKKILLKAFPDLDSQLIKIIPHKVDYIKERVKINNFNFINLAVIGNISIEKGGMVVKEVADYIEKEHLEDKIKIHIFGQLYDTSILQNKVITNHGQYKKTELPAIMKKNEINCVFIPSIWPETFSYTTEEAILMDLPVAVFNLGAPAERVKRYSKGIILDNKDPEYIVKKIFNFFRFDV
ncbi:MAG: glycosyltransferase [Candidatus Micrarchaeaceae archaeon]